MTDNLILNEETEKISQKNISYVITKFMQRGFQYLDLEDLAIAIISPDFKENFRRQTGQDWITKFEIKALEKLTRGNFDLHWMTRKAKNPDSYFFVSCLKGFEFFIFFPY